MKTRLENLNNEKISDNEFEKLKKFIDDMSYYNMLELWRFSPVGNRLFQGKLGTYFSKSMNEKKDKLSPEKQVEISKKIGWNP